ncbi:hypothetical protein BPODLACK_01800 [Gordonia sp. YY1]|nr:hypothetical protein BPODLACK_01800 [Gordonia sp. YY1]
MRHLAGEALEQHAREAVDVARRTGRRRVEQLGRHVRDRTDGGTRLREVRVVGAVGDTEIDEVGEVVGIDEDVLRLDVPVHQPLGVGGIECRGHLLDDRDRPCQLEPRLAAEQGPQVFAGDEAHVDEEHAVDLAPVVDRDDVWLTQSRRGVRLPAESLLVHGVLRATWVEQLQRDGTVLGGVVCPVDLSHAAPPQQRVETIGPELRADPAS